MLSFAFNPFPGLWHHAAFTFDNNSQTQTLYLDGVAGLVSSVSTSGKVITLRLSAASSATSITYLKGAGWDGNQAKLLRSARGLEIIGIDINGNYDDKTREVVTAFQRHYRPARVDGIADHSTVETLKRLLTLLKR